MMNDVPDFIQDLESATQRKGGRVSDMKVMNMKSWENHGTMYIVPFNGPNKSDSAIKQLNNVAVVEKWVSGTKKDGTPFGFVDRHYLFLDPKYYGELTQAQMERFEKLKSKFRAIPKEFQGAYTTTLTLIQAHVVKHTSYKDKNKILLQDSPALYVFQSKNFEKEFKGKVNSMVDTLGNYVWLSELQNNELQRKRYMEITFFLDKEVGAGYQASIAFKKFDEDAVKLTGGKIGLDLSGKENYQEKFGNPIKRFLSIPENGDIFNEEYLDDIESTINKILKGEDTSVTVKYEETPAGQVSAPNSNAGFKAQSEELPTSIGDTAVETPVTQQENTDDLPF